MKTYTVAVRALCEFAAKQGDQDLRFTPSPTSQQSIVDHQTVAASRSATFLQSRSNGLAVQVAGAIQGWLSVFCEELAMKVWWCGIDGGRLMQRLVCQPPNGP